MVTMSANQRMSRSRLGTAIRTRAPSSGTKVTRVRMRVLRLVMLPHPQPDHVGQNHGAAGRQPRGVGAQIAGLHAAENSTGFTGDDGAVVDDGVDKSLVDALPEPVARHGNERDDESPVVEFVDVIFVGDGAVEAAEAIRNAFRQSRRFEIEEPSKKSPERRDKHGNKLQGVLKAARGRLFGSGLKYRGQETQCGNKAPAE